MIAKDPKLMSKSENYVAKLMESVDLVILFHWYKESKAYGPVPGS